MNCEFFCSSSVKNAIDNLIEIALSLWIAFGSIVIFTVLILPTQEHGISLHLFMLSLIFFIQFSSVTQSCPTLCDPMNRSTPGLPVHHQLLEFTQTHVHRVSDAIQPSHPLSSPSPPAPNPSIKVFSNESTLCIRWPKYWSFSFSIIPSKEILGLISLQSKGLPRVFSR